MYFRKLQGSTPEGPPDQKIVNNICKMSWSEIKDFYYIFLTVKKFQDILSGHLSHDS